MLNKRQLFGKAGESLAANYLKKNGYTIITTNHRTKLGEIDIIAEEADAIVFIEVKARNTQAYGSPKSAITSRKKHQLSKAALMYLKKEKLTLKKARFDVVTIDTQKNRIEIVKNAFDLSYG